MARSILIGADEMHRLKRRAHRIEMHSTHNSWKTNEIWLLGEKSKSGTLNVGTGNALGEEG
jgi:hypothetical protein